MYTVRTMSYSRMRSYLDCPRLYKYQYIDRLDPPCDRPLELVRGDLMDRCLRLYHASERRPETPVDVLNCVEMSVADMEQAAPGETAPVRDEVAAMLLAYHRELGHVVGSPCRLQLSLSAQIGPISLYARADVVWQEGDVVNVMDWKVSEPPLEQQLLQMVFIHAGLRQLYTTGKIHHQIIAMRPRPVLVNVPLTQEIYREKLAAIHEANRQIARERDWPATPGRACRWCQYVPLCDATSACIQTAVF